MTAIPPPQPLELLPPLLACLPTAFLSPRPPPALLPLLSPILRQRVNLLSGNTSSGNGGWLSLLSWDSKRASKLATLVEGLHFEPHPVSGELEIEDVKTIQYRRLDQETLQSRLEVVEFDLLPVYVWCENDPSGGENGWRLAELRSLEDREDGTQWFDDAASANSDATPAPAAAQKPAPASCTPSTVIVTPLDDAEEDDDYWASYDRTPSRTPARTPAKRSPAPTSNLSAKNRLPSADELAYFARYASEVQPALDGHDPDEEGLEAGESTLRGEELTQSLPAYEDATPVAAGRDDPMDKFSELSAPRAASPSSQGSVERLEQEARDMTRAEVGVKQFVSTEIKSLFRLARSVGIDRSEFERLVTTELDVLGMMESDD